MSVEGNTPFSDWETPILASVLHEVFMKGHIACSSGVCDLWMETS